MIFLTFTSYLSASDTAYYQPAMTTYLPDKNFLTLEAEQKNFPKYNFNNQTTENSNSSLNKEKYINLFYLSPKLLGSRIIFVMKRDGASGINANWNGTVSRKTANAFKLTNDIMQLGITKEFSKLTLFAGMQRVYKKAYTNAFPTVGITILTNKAEGEAYGSILGASYRFKKYLFASLNYHSKVDVTLKGSNYSDLGTTTAQAVLTHPAKLDASIFLYTSKDALWLLGAEKKFWSAYQELDIDYGNALEGSAGVAIEKNWKDIMIYSFGHEHTFGNYKLLTLLAIGEDPSPDDTREFGTPFGRFTAYIFKNSYNLNKDLTLSLGYKHVDFETTYSSSLNGSFSTSGMNIFDIALQVSF